MTLVPVNTPTAIESIGYAEDAWRVAQKICRTTFVPDALRDQAEAVLACMMTGYEVGVGPMQALSKIHVIKGRPTMAAELMRALVLRGGHDLWIEESTVTKCTMGATRAGSSRETRMTFTMDDAKRAGVTGKEVWRQYPQAMLLARTTSLICRAVFPDVLAGLSYSAEEVEDGDVFTLEPGQAGAPVAPAPATKTRRATKAITTAPSPAETNTEPVKSEVLDAPPLPGEPGYDGPDQDLGASDVGPALPFPQAAAMRAREAGITTDENRHGLWLAITEGRTASAAELDPHEQAWAMEILDRLKELAGALGQTIDEVWVVLRGDGTVAHSSETVIPGAVVEVRAPEQYAGRSLTVKAPGSGADPGSSVSEAPAGTPGPDASPRPSTPPVGPETGIPADEAGWRQFMRVRSVKISDLAKLVSELRPNDSAGVNVGRLVADPELAQEVYERITGGAS